MTEAQQLLNTLQSWPFVRVERHGPRAFFYSVVGNRLFGTLDLSTGELVAERDSRRCLEVADATSLREAETLLRRCVDGERFEAQADMASP
jgi:hypothetical protein